MDWEKKIIDVKFPKLSEAKIFPGTLDNLWKYSFFNFIYLVIRKKISCKPSFNVLLYLLQNTKNTYTARLKSGPPLNF